MVLDANNKNRIGFYCLKAPDSRNRDNLGPDCRRALFTNTELSKNFQDNTNLAFDGAFSFWRFNPHFDSRDI